MSCKQNIRSESDQNRFRADVLIFADSASIITYMYCIYWPYLFLLHILCRHNVNSCSGNVLHDHIPDMHRGSDLDCL